MQVSSMNSTPPRALPKTSAVSCAVRPTYRPSRSARVTSTSPVPGQYPPDGAGAPRRGGPRGPVRAGRPGEDQMVADLGCRQAGGAAAAGRFQEGHEIVDLAFHRCRTDHGLEPGEQLGGVRHTVAGIGGRSHIVQQEHRKAASGGFGRAAQPEGLVVGRRLETAGGPSVAEGGVTGHGRAVRGKGVGVRGSSSSRWGPHTHSVFFTSTSTEQSPHSPVRVERVEREAGPEPAVRKKPTSPVWPAAMTTMSARRSSTGPPRV